MRSNTLSLVLSLALLSLTSVTHADEPATLTGAAYHGGAGYGLMGMRPVDLGAVAGDIALTMGGGGHVQLGRFLLGGEGHGLLGVSGDAGATSLAGGYGFLRAGMVLLGTARLSVYTLVGVGGGGVTIRGSADGAATETSMGGALFDAALGIDYRIVNPFDRDGRGFVLVGLRGGSTFARYDGDWTVAAGTDSPITGPYLRLVIGAGGRR